MGHENISTHTLTRRLTMHRIVLNMHQVYFNSQSHKEADTDIQNCNRNRRYFNSQPHKEADSFLGYTPLA